MASQNRTPSNPLRATAAPGWPDPGLIEGLGEPTVSDALLVLSRAVEAAADHIAVLDENGIVRYMNAAWCSSAGDQVGQSAQSILGPGYRHAEVSESVARGRVFRAIFDRTSDTGGVAYEETAISRVIDSSGGVQYVVVATDITDRMLAEDTNQRLNAALEKASQEWRATVDAITGGIVLLDSAGKMLRMNRFARDLMGGVDYSFVGMNIADLVLDEPWVTVQLSIGAGGREGAFRRQVADGSRRRTWEVSVIRPRDAANRIVVLILDISERLHLEESVRRNHVMSAMGDLVAGVAHEVRNPIFGISATLDAFEANLGETSEFRPYSAMLRREVERLKVLTRELLHYGRPAQIQLQPACIGQVIAAAAELCFSAAAKAGVTIANEVAADFGLCSIDAEKLERVFRNVIENAIQHSKAGGRVHVTAASASRAGIPHFVCEIRDGGSGFAPEDLPHVFEPFFSRRSGGTGLGLAIVHRAVGEHGGHVFASNAEEGGAIVTIEIPARDGVEAHA